MLVGDIEATLVESFDMQEGLIHASFVAQLGHAGAALVSVPPVVDGVVAMVLGVVVAEVLGEVVAEVLGVVVVTVELGDIAHLGHAGAVVISVLPVADRFVAMEGCGMGAGLDVGVPGLVILGVVFAPSVKVEVDEVQRLPHRF